MRSPIARSAFIAVTLILTSLLIACSGASTPGKTSLASGASSGGDVSSELESVFGDRLGRSKIETSSVIVEVAGVVSDVEMVRVLTAAASRNADAPAIRLYFMPRDIEAGVDAFEWNRASGRLLRWHGSPSPRSWLTTSPPDGQVETMVTLTPEGGIASGVDESSMQSYADGQPIPWDESVRREAGGRPGPLSE